MDIKECSICGYQIYPGHGSVLVKNNLKIFRFCGSKCRKLFLLKRNPIFIKWTSFNRAIRGLKVFPRENIAPGKYDPFSSLKKSYNFFLTLQTIYFYQKIEKFKHNRKIDFKINYLTQK